MNMEGDEGERNMKVGPFDHTREKPERASLHFDINTSRLAPETAQVVLSIKKLAEGLLFHWKSFPIILPDSITDPGADKASSDSKEGVVKFKDLFVTPTFDELEAVATDEHGKLKRLNKEQLAMIRAKGEFEVKSKNFPGQVHRWHLTNLLQKGRELTGNSFLKDLAKSLSLLIITARNRFCDDFFSLKDGAIGWCDGFLNLLDIAIGVPSTTPGNVCQKLQEERMHYLIAELDIKPNFKKELNMYCGYIKMHSQSLMMHEQKTTDIRPPPIPYRYQTPNGQEIDLRLFNKDLINNSMGILSNILERQAKGWHVQMRAKLIKHYQGQNLANEEISKLVTEDILNHYLERVFQAISGNAELEMFQPGIGDLLVSQAKSVIVMEKALQAVQENMETHKQEFISHLRKAHPVKSGIKAWMEEQVETFENDFAEQNLWTAHVNAIAMCEEQGMHQTVYFLRRDLTFIKEREAVLKKELSRVKAPTRTFQFSTKIWFPQNWVVQQFDEMGRSEVIPTVFKDTQPIPVKERSELKMTYTVEKSRVSQTSTRYPFWRWWNYLHRTWSLTWNLMYMFGIIIPVCSPVSLRALVWPSVFIPDLDQSSQDGSLFPRESSRTHTLVSRLRALWANVRRSRATFEATPDRGFLGKSLTRHFNRFWNYILKGILGSVLTVTFFPVICVVVSTTSIIAAILTPVWVPCFTLVGHVLFFLLFDLDRPRLGKNRVMILFEAVLWNMLLRGCIQPISALVIGAVVCPLTSLLLCLFGIFRRGGRIFWDTAMFHIIVKTKGRVPSSDSFVARRIAGPGLASNYFYQIHPEQALAAMESTIEQDEVGAWKKQMLDVIEEPCGVYKKFVDQCFKPFSANVSEEGTYLRLSQDTQKYTARLGEAINKRLSKLYTGLTPDLQRKIKLPERELKLSILYTSKMLEEFYPTHVIQRSDFSEDDFWEGQGLEYRDWQGLATKKMSQIFSPSFLVPLEEADNSFELKVNHMNVHRYGKMLASAKFHDDLDLVVELYNPPDDIDVLPPHFDVHCFDPRKKSEDETFHKNYSKKRCHSKHRRGEGGSKLEVPLPILHPAHIAVTVYNREHDQDPIDTSDIHCQRIIRATKEVPVIDFNELSSLEPSNTEELSTPDNNTTESFTLPSHLAIQEPSISEDAGSSYGLTAHSPSSSSPLYPNPPNHPVPLSSGGTSNDDDRDLDDGDDDDGEDNGGSYNGGRQGGVQVQTVYCEIENDNSCVIDTDKDLHID